MPRRLIKNGRHWALADRLLGEWLGDRTETGLSAAMGGLAYAAGQAVTCQLDGEGAEWIRDCVDGSCGADAVSRLLRARGFRKAGMTGSAVTYDRQPLYRKAAA